MPGGKNHGERSSRTPVLCLGSQRDKAAVKAGLTWSINNGMVEGHVTKLKRDLAANVRKGRICSASPAYPPCIVVRSRLLVRCGELRN